MAGKANSRIDAVLRAAKVDRIMLFNTSIEDPNFLYATGFKSGLFEQTSALIKKGKVKVYASQLEYGTAKAQAKPGVVVGKAETKRKELLKEIKGRRLGLNADFLPYTYYTAMKRIYKPSKAVDISKAFAEARLVKTENEINNIRKAVKITKTAMNQIRAHFKEGITEAQLAAKFDYISGELGSEKPSFETIVCFGSNSAFPHHSPGSRKLKKGDIILIDAGGKHNNYCSDLTRTFIFGREAGKGSTKQDEIYNVVKTAQKMAIESIKPGIEGKEVDKVARDYIDTFKGGKYKGTFIHSLGHSVGIEVHDGAGFWPGSKLKLSEGMVITVEPGVYVEGIGGVRIEDDILVTSNGAVVL